MLLTTIVGYVPRQAAYTPIRLSSYFNAASRANLFRSTRCLRTSSAYK